LLWLIAAAGYLVGGLFISEVWFGGRHRKN
jgi:hypothetical protein